MQKILRSFFRNCAKDVRFSSFDDLLEARKTDEWNDWKWQIQNRITTFEELEALIPFSGDEAEGIRDLTEQFRMAISPYYFSQINVDNLDRDPVRIQSIPNLFESSYGSCGWVDGIGEDGDRPVDSIVHRYPDRVLFLVTDSCSMYCRHCIRRRLVGKTDDHFDTEQIDNAVQYVKDHPEVRDVTISGGDPLVMETDRLEYVLQQLRAIEHVEILRIGSRTPVVLPMRIDEELCDMLKKYHPIYVNTHFNTPQEFTEESTRACSMLADAGIPLGNQTVLIRGVNDSIHVMKKLVQGLVKRRVRPYYLYMCSFEDGLQGFRTTIAKGMEIMEGLRGHTSGLCIPTFAIGAPGGGGKIPLMPNYLLSMGENKAIVRNYEGVISTYPEVEEYQSDIIDDFAYSPENPENAGDARIDGLAKLLLSDYEQLLALEPLQLSARLERKEVIKKALEALEELED